MFAYNSLTFIPTAYIAFAHYFEAFRRGLTSLFLTTMFTSFNSSRSKIKSSTLIILYLYKVQLLSVKTVA